MRGDKITCQKFVGFVGSYHDGELLAAQTRILEAHLAQCRKCQEYLEGYRTTIRLAKAAMENLDEQPVPADLVKKILVSASSSQK
jgi:anti-sigma factor RsiW